MSQIEITGTIGLDTTSADVRSALASAGDVSLLIHSPGGDVADGIAIYNALRAHQRNGNRITATVSGMAASMATYIAMVADDLAVEDNAVWMVHHPWTLAVGDHRQMRHVADMLGGLSRVLGAAYSKRTGLSADIINQHMDAETWLFGDEIVNVGYADSIIPAGEGEEDRLSAVAVAQAQFASMRDSMRDSKPDIEAIAALLPPKTEAAMADEKPAADEPQDDEVETMTLEIEIDESAIDARINQAINAERARVAAITRRCADVGQAHMAASLIESGASLADANAALVDAWVQSGGAEIRQSIQPQDEPRIDVDAIQARIFAQVSGKAN